MRLANSDMIGFWYLSKKLPKIDSSDMTMKNIDICVL